MQKQKPNPAAAVFAFELRRAKEQWERVHKQGMSNRRLGKLTDPTDPERGRRRAQRHLSGKTAPTDASRRVYAEILQAPELLPEPDDEEESMVAALMARIETASPEVLRRMLDEAVA